MKAKRKPVALARVVVDGLCPIGPREQAKISAWLLSIAYYILMKPDKVQPRYTYTLWDRPGQWKVELKRKKGVKRGR